MREKHVRPALATLVSDSATNLLAFFALTMAVVDLLGVTRGEITRLWIFFDFFQCLACGSLLIRKHGLFTTPFVVGSVAIQAVITTAMVPFMGVRPPDRTPFAALIRPTRP